MEEDGFELPVPPLRRGAFLNRLLPALQLAKPVETEVFDPRGTGGSNPSSSSRESGANLSEPIEVHTLTKGWTGTRLIREWQGRTYVRRPP